MKINLSRITRILDMGIVLLGLIAALVFPGPDNLQAHALSADAFGIETTIAEMNSQGESLQGQQIAFEGEAIGDLINASDGRVWLTLRDAQASISVSISSEMADQISHLGRYQMQGTRVAVVGVFQLACSEHDGPTDVHAESLTVVSEGGPVLQTPDFRLLFVGLVLVLVGGVLALIYRLLRERSR